MEPLLVEYANMLQCCGWNSAALITSDKSAIFDGLISTITMGKFQLEKIYNNNNHNIQTFYQGFKYFKPKVKYDYSKINNYNNDNENRDHLLPNFTSFEVIMTMIIYCIDWSYWILYSWLESSFNELSLLSDICVIIIICHLNDQRKNALCSSCGTRKLTYNSLSISIDFGHFILNILTIVWNDL